MQCSQEGGNKCQCCKTHVEKRKIRFRYIVKQMAKKRLAKCKKSSRPYRCRQWIRRKEWRTLKKIEKICPLAVCKHLGYCETSPEENGAKELLVKSKINTIVSSPSLWVELLDQQLEAYLTKDVCGEFEQLQALCVHLAASADSRRYAKIYIAVLHNDTKSIDNDLREEVKSAQASVYIDGCAACKKIIQSSTNFYLQLLVSVVYIVEDSTGESEFSKKKQ